MPNIQVPIRSLLLTAHPARTDEAGEVDGEDRKEHHACQGKQDGDNPAHTSGGGNVTPCRSGRHTGIPQTVPKVVKLGIDTWLEDLENEATIIYKGEQYHDVGNEKTRRKVAQQAIGNHREGNVAPH